MKALTLLAWLALSSSVYAQKPLFVRVYGVHGKKIDKGRILAVTDTTLQLNGKSGPDTIVLQNIGSIRTRHSAGHTIGISTAIGVVIGTVIGISSANTTEASNPDQLQVDIPGADI